MADEGSTTAILQPAAARSAWLRWRRRLGRHLHQRWRSNHVVLWGGAWTLVGKVVNALALLAITTVLARALPPTDFASYLLAFSAVTVLGTLCCLGLDSVAVRVIAEARSVEDTARVRGVVRSILLLLGGSMALASGAALLAAKPVFVHSSAQVAGLPMLLLGFWMAINSARLILAGILRGFQAMVAGAVFEGTLANSSTALVLATLYLAGFPFQLTTVLTITVACAAASGVLALLAVASLLGDKPAASCKTPIAALLYVGLPIAVTAAVGQFAGQIPLWVIANIGTGQEVASFGLGLQVSVIANLPFVALTLAGSPTAAQLNATRELIRLRSFLRGLSFLATVPAASVVAGTLLVGQELTALVFGPSYQVSALVAAVLCAGRLAQSITGLNEMLLAMTGGERVLGVVFAVVGCLMAPASLAGYHLAGILGVATANGLLVGLQGLVLALAAKRRLGFWPGLGRLSW